jgi:hypothetical protein
MSRRRPCLILALAAGMLSGACKGSSTPPVASVTPPLSAPAPAASSSRPPSQSDLDPTIQAYAGYSLPEWIGGVWHTQHLAERFTYNLRVNPFFQVGHFDGDTLLDIAIAVRSRDNGMAGIVIVHHGDNLITVLGAGTPIATSGPDFEWMGVWAVKTRDPAVRRPNSGWNWLSLQAPESASIGVWWDGERYQAEASGD